MSLVADYGHTSGNCYASDATLARRLGLSRGGVNAMLRAVDTSSANGQALIRSRANRRTGTLSRQVRPTPSDELAICIPAAARDVLPANLFKVYCLLSLRQHLDEATPLAQIATACSITVATARRCAAELIASGWISRCPAAPGTAFHYRVHQQPNPGQATQLALFPQQQPSLPAHRIEEGAGPDATNGDDQLALFPSPAPPVDSMTAPPGNDTTAPPVDPMAQPRTPEEDPWNRRARGGCCSRAAAPSARASGNAATGDAECFPAPMRRRHRSDPGHGLPEDLADALAPVADLWRQIQRPGARTRVVAAVRQELAVISGLTGHTPAAAVLADRLLRRRSQQGETQVADPVGWLLRRGLPARPGCGDRLCDEGSLISTREPCPRCEENLAAKRATRHQEFTLASASACIASTTEIRRMVEAQLRQRHELHQQAELQRRQAAADQRALHEGLRERERAARAQADAERLALPCRRCGRLRSGGLCGECTDIAARERAVADCVALVLASSTTPEGRALRHELAARLSSGVEAEVEVVLREAAAGGATTRTLAALGRITAENLKSDYQAGALATMSTSPAAIAEGRRAYAASRHRPARQSTPAAAEADARRAASQAQFRAAQHLLNQRLDMLRRTPGPWNETRTLPGAPSRGAWTCAYDGCSRLHIGAVPDSGMCPPCERKTGTPGSVDATASPRIRAQIAARLAQRQRVA